MATRNRHAGVAALAVVLALFAACTNAPRYTSYKPEPSRVTPGDRSVDVGGGEVLARAQDFLGTPYRSGGTSSNGVDCSGLVFSVYKSFGIALPRTSRDQSRFGAEVDRNRLAPGDLVFFRTNGRSVSHVGIYAGRGRFIHASTRARKVRFDRLDNKYFRDRFVVARRVL